MKSEKVMYDSGDAATYRTNIKGWVDNTGLYFGDREDSEHSARYSGCSHRACDCGEEMEKFYTKCPKCRAAREVERYNKKEKKEWNGQDLLYSEAHECYINDLDALHDLIVESESPESELRLVICDPTYLDQIDTDTWTDVMPEDWQDDDLPPKVLEALNNLNAVIEKAPHVSWFPGKYAAAQITDDKQ